MSKEKLERAPIYNLSTERSVGFINYELKIRRSAQLACVSSAQVKANSANLIEKVPPGSFKHCNLIVKSKGKLSEIMNVWAKKQDELLQRKWKVKK